MINQFMAIENVTIPSLHRRCMDRVIGDICGW